MVVEASGFTASALLESAIWQMRVSAVEEPSRNGPVMTIPKPVIMSLWDPVDRIIYDERRDANHFFHVMEFIWMMAGQDDVDWISQFNKGYLNYAEDNGKVWGAYGYRWSSHFNSYGGDNPNDQIGSVIRELRRDPASRRAVIAMWDPACDLAAPVRDVPCNTHIYFRIVGNQLDMLVMNRSNDLIWGALGANIVHMTMLHELVALALGRRLGTYRVMTNNLHMYKDREDFEKMWKAVDIGMSHVVLDHYPLLHEGETYEAFIRDAEDFVDSYPTLRTKWFQEVAWPMRAAYLDKVHRTEHIAKIAAPDWRIACQQWASRREISSSTSTVQSR